MKIDQLVVDDVVVELDLQGTTPHLLQIELRHLEPQLTLLDTRDVLGVEPDTSRTDLHGVPDNRRVRITGQHDHIVQLPDGCAVLTTYGAAHQTSHRDEQTGQLPARLGASTTVACGGTKGAQRRFHELASLSLVSGAASGP